MPTPHLEDKVEDFLKKNPNCPNPEHSPKTVEYLVRMYKYYKEREEDDTPSQFSTN